MNIRRVIRVTVAMAACAAIAAPAAPAVMAAPSRSHAHSGPIDDEAECLEAVPAAAAVSQTQSSRPTLDALVLADGIAVADAREQMKLAAQAYDKAGVTLKYTVRKQRFTKDGSRTEGGKEVETIGGDRLMADAKALFRNGERPKGIDVVYVMTTKDLWKGDSDNRDYSLAGRADCIGGVRYANRAFAVGEVGKGFDFVVMFSPDYTAVVAAHEIGHLMGAHHHYAVCGPTAANAARLRGDVCTLMFPEASTPALEFSPTNSAIVYGHADSYAR